MIYHILLLQNSLMSKKHPKKFFACGATCGSAPHPAHVLPPLVNVPPPDFPLATPMQALDTLNRIIVYQKNTTDRKQ